MKTSVELNDKKIALAKKLSQSSTIREVLDLALDALIADKTRKSILNVIGSGAFQGDLDEMRKRRGPTY